MGENKQGNKQLSMSSFLEALVVSGARPRGEHRID